MIKVFGDHGRVYMLVGATLTNKAKRFNIPVLYNKLSPIIDSYDDKQSR